MWAVWDKYRMTDRGTFFEAGNWFLRSDLRNIHFSLAFDPSADRVCHLQWTLALV